MTGEFNMWIIGSVELEEYEYPVTVRLDVPHQLKTVTAPGMSPYIYSMGLNAEVLELTCWLKESTAMQLKELLRNTNMQPFRVVANGYGGFYYFRSFRAEERGGVLNFRLARLGLYLYGTTATYTSAYFISDLSTVTNDWGI